MTRRQGTAVDGINILDEVKIPAFDIHCPLMGTSGEAHRRLNYWKSRCKVRQKDSRLRDTCYPTCKVDKEVVFSNLPNGFNSAKMKLGRKWLSMRKLGTTYRDIAAKAGVSPATIRRYVQAATLEKQL